MICKLSICGTRLVIDIKRSLSPKSFGHSDLLGRYLLSYFFILKNQSKTPLKINIFLGTL